MSIREDVVVSATKFLQDPNVASSPINNRIAFLRAKNLTQDEIDVALARAADPGATLPNAPPLAGPPPPPFAPSAYYGRDAAYGWHPPPPEPLRRDWRDWFILATVMGSFGYGLYAVTMRYIYPLIAPPTPGRLEQDKKLVDQRFERAFELIEQLNKNTAKLAAAEAERTEHFDTSLADLDNVIGELKRAHDQREDDARKLRDDMRGLQAQLPRLLEAQKESNEARMREVTGELRSLRTLLGQRMNPSNHLRPSSGNAPAAGSRAGTPVAEGEENTIPNAAAGEHHKYFAPAQQAQAGRGAASYIGSGMSAAIPAWQRATQTTAPQGATTQATAGQPPVPAFDAPAPVHPASPDVFSTGSISPSSASILNRILTSDNGSGAAGGEQ